MIFEDATPLPTVLTVAPGGKLDVPAGVTIAAKPGTGGTATIDASQASVAYKGELNVASGTLILNAPPGAPLPGGAVAHWSFNNTANLGQDSAGSYHGTLLSNTGGPLPQAVTGVIGGAIDFERDYQNYIDLPDGFANFTGGISVATWVNYESFTNWNRVIDFGNGPSNNNILLARSTTTPNLRWEFHNTAGGTETHDVAGVLPNNQWIHVAATVTPGATNACVSTIYINGVPVSVKSDHTLPAIITRTINYIGRSNWAGDDYLDAVLDELIIYNRPLSGAEVGNLYRAGLQGGYGPARFGDLVMARDTTLRATTNPVGFSTATLGNNATLIGDITLDRRLALGSTAFIRGPSGNDGVLRISDGLLYEWVFRDKYWHDLVTVSGDLHFDKSFTLRIFPAGSLNPTDMVPIFLYSGTLEVAGDPNRPLDYVIEIGNLADSRYIWDTSAAELWVGLGPAGKGIYLTGLFVQAIPEPGTLTILALGALALMRRRRGVVRRAP